MKINHLKEHFLLPHHTEMLADLGFDTSECIAHWEGDDLVLGGGEVPSASEAQMLKFMEGLGLFGCYTSPNLYAIMRLVPEKKMLTNGRKKTYYSLTEAMFKVYDTFKTQG